MKKVLKRCIAIGTSTILLISMFATTASAQSWNDVNAKAPVSNVACENSANLVNNSSASDIAFGLKKSEMANKVATITENDQSDPTSVTSDDVATIQSYINTYAPDANVNMYLPKKNPKIGITPMLAGDGSSKFLNLPGQVQLNDYYCGPETAYAILGGRGISTTQAKMATLAGTTSSGTVMSNLLSAMNSYNGTNGNYFKYAVVYGPGSNTTAWYNTMTADAITTLNGGYGTVYNVHMVNTPGSARLAGYDTMVASNIYHYVAGEGYNSTNTSNRICDYYDSNNEKSNLGTRHEQISFTTMAILTDDMSIGF